MESCIANNECGIYEPLIAAGKPVFQIEYPSGAPGRVGAKTLVESCEAMEKAGFSTVIKEKRLDGWVEYCDGSVANSSVSNGG